MEKDKSAKSNTTLVNRKLDELNFYINQSKDSQTEFMLSNTKSKTSVPSVINGFNAHKALECIDEIHEEQNQKLVTGIPQLKQQFEQWAKRNYLPCQMDSIMTLAIMDARHNEEKRQLKFTEQDYYKAEEIKEDLDRIRNRFNIEIDHEHFNSDQQLFKSFLSMNPQAYFNFKTNSNVGRTLVKEHFKPKFKTTAEKRADEVMKLNALDLDNQATLKRLRAELEELKIYNKPLYHLNLKNLSRVINSHRQGYSVHQMQKLIADLPNSYLPDEQDIALHRTMTKLKAEEMQRSLKGSNAHTMSFGQETTGDEVNGPQPKRDSNEILPNLDRQDSTQNIINDSIMSAEMRPSASQLINVTDFTADKDIASRERILIDKSQTKIEKSFDHGGGIGSKKRRQKRDPEELKLIELHMKRKVPHLYLSKLPDRQEKLNQFNSVLKRSLLSPQRQRYVSTKREQQFLERSNQMSQKTSRNNRSRKRDWNMGQQNLQQQAGGVIDSGHLPIISVGSSVNSSVVDLREILDEPSQNMTESREKNDASAVSSQSKQYKRINSRFNRGKQSVTLETSTGLQLASDRDQSCMREESTQSPSSQMRGVSPLIRGHLRNRSHQQSDIFKMTTSLISPTHHGDIESQVKSITEELKNPHSKKSLNSTMVRKILTKTNRSKASSQVASTTNKEANQHKQMVQEIISKVGRLRGTDPTGSNLQELNEKVQTHMLSMQIRNRYITDTADQVQQFSDYHPTILKWLFNEQLESTEDENETQRNAIAEFENRKLDYKYFNMIETRERNNFNKQTQSKKGKQSKDL